LKIDLPPTARRDDESPGATPEQFAIDLSGGDDRSASAVTDNRWLAVAIGLAVLIHLVIDLVLVVVRPWEFGESSRLSEMLMLFALAVPFAQASLVCLLATRLRLPLYGRFVVGIIGGFGVWFVTVKVLPNASATGAESGGWATCVATQIALMSAAVAARSLPRDLFAALSANADESARRRFQFGVGSLLIWTTLVAVLLGLGQVIAARLDWNRAVTGWEYFYFCPVLGSCNAVYALLVVLSLSRRRRTIVWICVASVTIAILSCFQPLVFTFIFGDTGGIDYVATLILACTQAALLYATLLPVRAVGRA